MNGNIPQQIRHIVKETTSELHKIYHTHLKDVIVFGSYARGDFTENSDIDLCILLDEMQSVVSEREKYSSVISTLCLKYDVFPENIAYICGAAFCYDYPEDPKAVELQGIIREKGIDTALREVSSVDPESPLGKKIIEAYHDLQDKRKTWK